MIYPSTASLTSDGTGTAELTPPSGFGEGFGEAFGGWVTTVRAVVTGSTVGSAQQTAPTGTAVLAGDGVSTAAVIEAPALAELQLV